MWGRLSPGASPQMAEAELTTLTADLRRQHPKGVWENERLLSNPGGHAELTGAVEVFTIVGILVLLILAVACGNLGSLLLARGASRQREMALRSAIGAGPGRLIRQLFTESLVLALMGCLGGLALGSLVLKGIIVWTDAPDVARSHARLARGDVRHRDRRPVVGALRTDARCFTSRVRRI